MKIAVLGSGMVGNAIATKLVSLGHQIMMGSRTRRLQGRSVCGSGRRGA